MIKSFYVKKLFGKWDYKFNLNPDINIFTGKNGSGKTTLLKLIWYMISPNIERIIPEIFFNEAEVKTDEFALNIKRNSRDDEVVFTYKEQRKKPIEVQKGSGDEIQNMLFEDELERMNKRIRSLSSGSLFFPTFRRIEGGFSIRGREDKHSGIEQLSRELLRYTNAMSVSNHRFIASLSTEDIEQLLTSHYADVSEVTNKLHQELSEYISKIVPPKKPQKKGIQNVKIEKLFEALSLIEDIRQKRMEVDKKREKIMQPFNVLAKLIQEIFKDKGIQVSKTLTFGETKEAIKACYLSAGEKQMLSFLCYNAFIEDSPIFIDEPELSLHGDWQRKLFSILLSQKSTNQFIISTHSPFIYSKYPEKEIRLDIERGE